VQPDPRDVIDATLVARERTLAELAARVTTITAELSDEEVLWLLHSILGARVEARRGLAPVS
jgi:hypothetical protein